MHFGAASQLTGRVTPRAAGRKQFAGKLGGGGGARSWPAGSSSQASLAGRRRPFVAGDVVWLTCLF